MTAVGWIRAESLIAQDDARKALIGTWEGIVTQGAASGPVRLEFSEQGETLGWKWTWEASFGRGVAEGVVEGWIEFVPSSCGPVLSTSRETSQSNLEALTCWATGLEPVYLEGALARSIAKAPSVA